MEKAESIIKSALQEIKVQAAEAPIEQVDAQDAVLYMNRMMAAFAADGVNLGYTSVSNLGDDVTIPDGAIEGVVFNLAVRLGNSYGFPIGQILFANAQRGENVMRRIALNLGPMSYPDTLPIGSGNEDQFNRTDKFYPQEDTPIE